MKQREFLKKESKRKRKITKKPLVIGTNSPIYKEKMADCKMPRKLLKNFCNKFQKTSHKKQQPKFTVVMLWLQK